jgi:hypothetical protein
MLANEAFIRRASSLNYPFMLKGSYITRQYFPNPELRIPADLDWVYLNHINYYDEAKEIFDDWAKLVTEIKEEDGVKFRSFTKNAFWRRIDYAMADDFPTVNTDVMYWVNDYENDEIRIDISFNLDINIEPVPIEYQPLKGNSFFVPNAVPLSLQVAWKIHQTLVRLRFKDLFDLIYLLQHGSYNYQSLYETLQALVNECHVGNVDIKKFEHFLNLDLEKLTNGQSFKNDWEYWRNKINVGKVTYYDCADYITNAELLPKKLEDFLDMLRESMFFAGLTTDVMKNLPFPNTKKNSIAKKKSKRY